jgi:hypothetical protein
MRTLSFARVCALGLLSGLLGGCFEASIHSGRPPGDVPRSHDHRWHHGFLLGALESSAAYDLSAICPRGWSEVHSESDSLQVFLAIFTLGIYTPQNVTIVCAAPPGSLAAPPDPLAGVE